MVSQNNSGAALNLEIGARVECSGSYGTVCYIGEVEGYDGTWIGVDWDDPNRGKHNGTVGNVYYFLAKYKTSASFVRPAKLSLGQTAAEAFTSRYGTKEDDLTARKNQQEFLALQKVTRAPFIEMVGFEKITDKQSDFFNLKVVNLRMQTVRTAGETGELRSLCPNIEELDVSKNLIVTWEEVLNFCKELDYLKWLNISENIFSAPSDELESLFAQLKTLVAGNVRATWNDVITMASYFPCLEELRVPFNLITSLSLTDPSVFNQIKILDLEENNIVEWEEVLKLSCLENLEELLVAKIGLKCIRYPSLQPGDKFAGFSKLKRLSVSDNLIDDWQSISELDRFQCLEDLRIARNPVMNKDTRATCVQWVVARLGNLKFLDGTRINDEERRGAEYDYIKKYGLQWIAAKNALENFTTEHPRYTSLIKKYGAPEESELKVLPTSLKSSLMTVILVYGDKMVAKKVPPAMLIQKLMMLAQRVFNLKDRPSLSLVNSKKPDLVLDLDEFKELNFYGVEDNDRIVVRC